MVIAVILYYFVALVASALELDLRQETCAPDCYWDASYIHQYYWSSRTVTTTLVAASVLVSINTDAHTTVRSTEYLTLPDGYTLPQTNSLGTQVTTLAISTKGSVKQVVLTYPTEFSSYPDGYTWVGTLFTSGECRTELFGVFVPYSSAGPEYGMPATPYPESDSLGLFYSVATHSFAGRQLPGDSDGAASCHPPDYASPPGIGYTAKFITSEMTVTGGGAYTPPPLIADPPSAPTSAGPTPTSGSIPRRSSLDRPFHFAIAVCCIATLQWLG